MKAYASPRSALIVCLALVFILPAGYGAAQQNAQPVEDNIAETIAETVMDAAVRDVHLAIPAQVVRNGDGPAHLQRQPAASKSA
jgi:hypothetical protein